MKKYIEFIKKINKEALELKKTIIDNKKYLKAGRYKVNTAYKKIGYISCKESKTFLNKNRHNMERNYGLLSFFKLLIRKFIEMFYTVKIFSDSNYNADLIMITQSNDLKFINFTENKIYNIFNNKEMFSTISDAYYTFRDYFNIPIIEIKRSESLIIESYINFLPFNKLTNNQKEEAIEKIYSNYSNYFSNIESTNKDFITTQELLLELQKVNKTLKIPQLKNLIKSIPKESYDEKFPVVKCSGDVVFPNILFYNNDYHFIDWEHSGRYIFFYDLLNYIIVESMSGNSLYLIDFTNGKYDYHLKKIFKIFDIDYISQKKSYYLGLFIIYKIIYRCNYDVIVIERLVSWYLNNTILMNLKESEAHLKEINTSPNKYKISVIIPVYNGEKHINKCIKSIINQDIGFENIQLIIVDDGSTDNTSLIIEKYAKLNNNIRYYYQKNSGAASARNYGLEKAIGEYISFVDSDDALDCKMLSSLYLIAKNEKQDIVTCDMFIVNKSQKKHCSFELDKNPVRNFILMNSGPCNMIISHKLIKTNSFHFPEGISYEDLAVIPSLALYTNKIKLLPQPLYYYIQNEGSTMNPKSYNKNFNDIFKSINILKDKFDCLDPDKKYYEELEFIYIRRLLMSASLRFIKFNDPDNSVSKIRRIIELSFQNWEKNKYYRRLPYQQKLVAKLVYKNRIRTLKILINLKKITKKIKGEK